MSKRVVAAINPGMLTWARETQGLAIGEAAIRLRMPVERLRAWESGDPKIRPSVPQAEKLAKFYDRQLSMLYLPQPPTEPDLPPDFRLTMESESHVADLEPELRKVIRRVRALRDAAVSLAEDMREEQERFPAIGVRATLNDDAEKSGVAARKWLGISDEPHTRLADGDGAFGTWRTMLEDRGVLVFVSMDRVPVKVFRGFSLVSDRAPAIAINTKDWKPARLFTLVHEFGHIVLGTSGICGDLDDLPTNESEKARIEWWCNRFAGAALVPAELLRAEQGVDAVIHAFARAQNWDHDDDSMLRHLARRFAVSAEVIARRLEIMGAISRADFRTWRTAWYARYPVKERELKEGEEMRIGQSKMAPYRLGFGYLRVVFEAYWSERIGIYDLCRLVGNVQVQTARKIEDGFKAKLFALAV